MQTGNESHAGQVFCCVAALHLAGALDRLDTDLTCWWYALPCVTYHHGIIPCSEFATRPAPPFNPCLSRLAYTNPIQIHFYHELSKGIQNLAQGSSKHILQLLKWLPRLCERQTRSGGLNGRPEKLQDVCYSWWCLSALSILDRLHWIDRDALSSFILQCQVRSACPSQKWRLAQHTVLG